MTRGLDFHATAPGAWVNDPNGLVYADGAYRLFAQHSSGLEDRRIGWCRWSSADLLRWTFDGVVIPPEGDRWMYSGSVVETGDQLIAFHTVHQNGLEHQVSRSSGDAGRTWSGANILDSLGPRTRNRRDPFVFKDAWGWGLLLAEPCDWTSWQAGSPSRLRLYRSPNLERWQEVGSIGPWRPSGIIWEVPVLVRIGGQDVLFVSEVDRRDCSSRCAVHAWIGTMQRDGFVVAQGVPPEGQLMDLGPDFYALMVSRGANGPLQEPVYVGWASNWASARTRRWPDFQGGPITLPRTIAVKDVSGVPWLMTRPAQSIMDHFQEPSSHQPASGLARIRWEGDQLSICADNRNAAVKLTLSRSGVLLARRDGAPSTWEAEVAVPFSARKEVLIFIDGPLIEVFAGGASFVVALEGQSPVALKCMLDGRPTGIVWTRLDRQSPGHPPSG